MRCSSSPATSAGWTKGWSCEESIARAAATSGGAVFFAGCTVTIALVSLAVAQIPLVTTMGIMAAIAVVVAVLAALTLLPAMLGILGPHINSLRVRRPPTEEQAQAGLWAKWAADIAKQPVIAGLAALAILIPLAIPLLSLSLGQQDTAALSTSTTARRAYDQISENFGAGVNGPLIVVGLARVRQPTDTSDSRLTTLQKDVAGDLRGVRRRPRSSSTKPGRRRTSTRSPRPARPKTQRQRWSTRCATARSRRPRRART